MSDIEKQIEEVAETMEKSTENSQDRLFETIRKLGPEGIRAKLPTLEKSERELLCSALEEMKKAVSMDDQYQAKYVQGKITNTIIQEDKADDDQDEKLVKPEAAKMNHQGTPTDGWQGQVIKSVEASDEQMDTFIEKAMKMCSDDEEKVKGKLKGKMDEKKVQGAVDRYKMKKAKSPREDAKEKIMEMEEKEHGSKDPKKVVEAEKKEHKMKKSEEGSPNPEEGQVKDNLEKLQSEKSRADKKNPKELELAEDNKDAQKKVNDLGQGKMSKSAAWSDENSLLKARTQGRNHHFSVNGYYDQVLAETTKEATKPESEMKKSEPKMDSNDYIEKGMDSSRDDVICKSMLAENEKKTKGKFVKSFADEELAEALGLTVEQAKKILGE